MTELVNFYQSDTRILMYHMYKMERKVLRISELNIIVLVSLHSIHTDIKYMDTYYPLNVDIIQKFRALLNAYVVKRKFYYRDKDGSKTTKLDQNDHEVVDPNESNDLNSGIKPIKNL